MAVAMTIVIAMIAAVEMTGKVRLLEGKVYLPDADPKYFFAVFFHLLKQASVDGSDIPEDLKPYLEKVIKNG